MFESLKTWFALLPIQPKSYFILLIHMISTNMLYCNEFIPWSQFSVTIWVAKVKYLCKTCSNISFGKNLTLNLLVLSAALCWCTGQTLSIQSTSTSLKENEWSIVHQIVHSMRINCCSSVRTKSRVNLSKVNSDSRELETDLPLPVDV